MLVYSQATHHLAAKAYTNIYKEQGLPSMPFKLYPSNTVHTNLDSQQNTWQVWSKNIHDDPEYFLTNYCSETTGIWAIYIIY